HLLILCIESIVLALLIQFLFSGPIFRMIIGILNMLKYVLDESLKCNFHLK
ncbi:unnamed protein product, partial [Onchocerca ochengi]|uniref:Odorant receptor n=1 Tax=Onchocerca ochengi TaxID=42157 RepID=A0A182EZR9_ONCOC